MWLLVFGFLYLLLLNGTRQLMLSCMIGFALVVFYYLGRLRLGLVPVIFVMALVAGFVVKRSAETVFADRVAGTALQHELSLSRGAIWADAFEQMRARPLFGVGFRNYGAYNLAYNEETGQIVESKDNAHGYFQEVFVEHGIVLGMAALIASLGGLLLLLYRAVLSRNEFLHGLAFLNVVLFPPVLFSGAIYSVQAPYILAVSLLALGAHASTDRIYYRKTFPSMHSAPGFVAR
jgi:O-antigen ligase